MNFKIIIFQLLTLGFLYPSQSFSQKYCDYDVESGKVITYNSNLKEYSWSGFTKFRPFEITFYSDRFTIEYDDGTVTYDNIKSNGKDGEWNQYTCTPGNSDKRIKIAIKGCTYTDMNTCNCAGKQLFFAPFNIWYYDKYWNPQGGRQYNIKLY